MSVGLIAALPAEVRCLTHACPGLNIPFAITPHLVGIVCGIGSDNAAAAAKTLLNLDIEAIVSWGTAGALARELRSGDLLLPESILATDGRCYKADGAWLTRLRQTLQQTSITIHNGPVAETREILNAPAQKRELHVRTGAIGVDMETAVIMKEAATGNLPCIAIRSVVDEADTAIPDAFIRHIDRYGKLQLTGMLTEIFRSPGLLGELFRLGTAMHMATTTLKTLVTRTNATLMYSA